MVNDTRWILKAVAASLATGGVFSAGGAATAGSVAREWNEENLDAIRVDIPHPPVHARNLFHVSVAMWDAWAAYDAVAVGYMYNEAAVALDPGGDGIDAADIAAAREQAISFAAYRVLKERYKNSANAAATEAAIDAQMLALGYDKTDDGIVGPLPPAVGNRIAAAVLSFSLNDGANEANGYVDGTYVPVNDPLPLDEHEYTLLTVFDPNRWQPISFGEWAFTQNGLQTDLIQTFQGSHWRAVRPFAMRRAAPGDVYHDPGAPPQLGGVGDEEFKDSINEVLRYSSWLDPDDGVDIDLSPAVHGNNTLGQNDGTGHGSNPVTGGSYASNVAKRADYGRVVAEFWADGPESETPPGHWNVLANEITDHPGVTLSIGGSATLVDELEWDVKRYFAMNGAMHDAATAAWTCKRAYDYVRPITMARYMGILGQSSELDNIYAFFDAEGLKLEPGLVEVITPDSSDPGERHEHLRDYIGEIAIFVWAGEPDNPATQYSGTAWIRALYWLPYQRDTFVTPAFAGYVSGHSCFSRAGAEVMTLLTGSPYFPGGLWEHTETAGSLDFEFGPTADVTLQWASYYDAADEAGLSRLYGGIHVRADDGPGRIIGSRVGIDAYGKAESYWDGSILLEEIQPYISYEADATSVTVDWDASIGLYYKVQSSPSLTTPVWTDETGFVRAETIWGTFTKDVSATDPAFFRVRRNASGS